MNAPELLREQVSGLIPGASISIDSPSDPSGDSWIDIETNEQTLTVAYRPSLGFGLYSSDSSSFGSGPDEVYRDIDALLKRIKMILIEHKIDIMLKEVRELLGKKQREVSFRSGQGQPSISKLENRVDMQVSTIERFVTSLGGTLEIKAHFKEFDVPLKLTSDKKTIN